MKAIIFILSIFLIYPVYGQSTKTVARVNKQIITSKDLNDYCKIVVQRLSERRENVSCDDDSFKNSLLSRLVEDKLILDKASQKNYNVPSKLVNEKLQEMASSYQSPWEFEQALIERGLTITKVKEMIKEQYIVRQAINEYVNSYVSISPQEVSEYYNSHQDEFHKQERYLLWAAQSKNITLLKKIGHDITGKGIEYAKDKYSRILFPLESSLDDLNQEISREIKKMKNGDYFLGFIEDTANLVYFEKILPSSTAAIEDVKDAIYDAIRKYKFQKRFEIWVSNLKDDAIIRIY